jgi:hypothetical protein
MRRNIPKSGTMLSTVRFSHSTMLFHSVRPTNPTAGNPCPRACFMYSPRVYRGTTKRGRGWLQMRGASGWQSEVSSGSVALRAHHFVFEASVRLRENPRSAGMYVPMQALTLLLLLDWRMAGQRRWRWSTGMKAKGR